MQSTGPNSSNQSADSDSIVLKDDRYSSSHHHIELLRQNKVYGVQAAMDGTARRPEVTEFT